MSQHGEGPVAEGKVSLHIELHSIWRHSFPSSQAPEEAHAGNCPQYSSSLPLPDPLCPHHSHVLRCDGVSLCCSWPLFYPVLSNSLVNLPQPRHSFPVRGQMACLDLGLPYTCQVVLHCGSLHPLSRQHHYVCNDLIFCC